MNGRFQLWSIVLAAGFLLAAGRLPADDAGRALRDAIVSGDLKAVQTLVEKGADVNAAVDEATPLMNAAYYGHTGILRFLLEKGADANQRNSQDWSPLMAAAKGGSADAVKLLIEKGANVRARKTEIDPSIFSGDVRAQVKGNGPSALSLAVEFGYRDIANLLLDASAPLNEKYNGGETVLLTVLRNGQMDLAHDILKRKPELDIQNDQGQNALLLAVRRDDHELVKELLDSEANINLIGKDGYSALMLAIQRRDTEMARFLLSKNADFNAIDGNDSTPLMMAGESGSIELVKELLAKGANPEAKDRNGKTVLDRAMDLKQTDVVQFLMGRASAGEKTAKATPGYRELLAAMWAKDIGQFKKLLEQGADVNARGPNGRTILMDATDHFFLDFVRLLIEKGADVNAADSSGATAASLAHHPDYIAVLTKAGAKAPPNPNAASKPDKWRDLEAAVRKGDAAKVDGLLKQEVDPNRPGVMWPLIVRAAEKGQTDIIRALLDHKADVNAKGYNNWTALMEAAGNGHLDTMKLLLEKGAVMSIPLMERGQRTALDLAKERNFSEAVKLLLENGYQRKNYHALLTAIDAGDFQEQTTRVLADGVDTEAVNEKGETVLFDPSVATSKDRAAFLISKGAKVDHLDAQKRTPLMAAIEAAAANAEALEVAKILVARGADANATDATGNTPVKMARRLSDPKFRDAFVKLLKDAGAKE
jgi:ankyrin repeat protein